MYYLNSLTSFKNFELKNTKTIGLQNSSEIFVLSVFLGFVNLPEVIVTFCAALVHTFL